MVLERKLGLKMIPGGPLEEVPRKYFAKNRVQRTSDFDNGPKMTLLMIEDVPRKYCTEIMAQGTPNFYNGPKIMRLNPV